MLACRASVILFAAALSAAPQTRPSFEVASIKPAPEPATPGAQAFGRFFGNVPLSLKPRDPARLRIARRSLRDIIAAAYAVQPLQVIGPAWTAEDFFEIEATIPEGQVPQAPEMLQVLLEERFGLKLHRESRPVNGYELVVSKGGSKLKPAGPAPEMTPEQLKQRVQDEMKNAGAAPRKGALNSFAGPMTMPELCTRLSSDLGSLVTDGTSLEGKFAVRIETSSGNPDEPDVTLFDAVAKLGLKLEARKMPVETLVIDAVSKLPTEN